MSAVQSTEIEQSAEFSYLLMKVALTHFDKSLQALDSNEKHVVEKLAGKEKNLQDLILGAIEAYGTYVPDSVIDNAIDEIRQRYSDDDEFLRDLGANNLDLSSLRESVRKEMLVEAVLDRVGSRSADVSDIDVQLYYYLHIEKLNAPERRKVRHILVTINEEMPENTRERALARLEVIHNRVRKNPARFDQQALQYSECPSSLHGGLIGTVPRGQLYPQLDDELFKMKKGQISGIIESEMGFHVLLCEGVEPSRRLSLQEMRPGIRKKLEEKQKKRCQGVWLKDLINSAKELNRG